MEQVEGPSGQDVGETGGGRLGCCIVGQLLSSASPSSLLPHVRGKDHGRWHLLCLICVWYKVASQICPEGGRGDGVRVDLGWGPASQAVMAEAGDWHRWREQAGLKDRAQAPLTSSRLLRPLMTFLYVGQSGHDLSNQKLKPRKNLNLYKLLSNEQQ